MPDKPNPTDDMTLPFHEEHEQPERTEQKQEGIQRPLPVLDSKYFPRMIRNRVILEFNPQTGVDRFVDANDNVIRILSKRSNPEQLSSDDLDGERNIFLSSTKNSTMQRLELMEEEVQKRLDILSAVWRGEPHAEEKSFTIRILPNDADPEIDADDIPQIPYQYFKVYAQRIANYVTREGETVKDCMMVDWTDVTDLIKEIESLRSQMADLVGFAYQQIEQGDVAKKMLVKMGVEEEEGK